MKQAAIQLTQGPHFQMNLWVEGREGPGSLFLNHNSKKIFTLYVIGNRFEITPSRFVIISAY